MNKKSLTLVVMIYIFAFCLFSLNGNAANEPKPDATPQAAPATTPAPEKKPEAATAGALVIEKKPSEKKKEPTPEEAAKLIPKGRPKKMFANFEIESDGKPMGTIRVKLHHQLVPNTVDNFVGLVEGTKEFTESVASKGKPGDKVKRRFYDGTIFHRIIPGFMIQGGDPQGSGRGGPGYEFKDEFHPSLKHDKKYVLSMANRGANTNGSQFFITVAPTPHLDNKHAIFGEVVSGQDVVDKVAGSPRDNMDKPKTDIVIKKITIDREF